MGTQLKWLCKWVDEAFSGAQARVPNHEEKQEEQVQAQEKVKEVLYSGDDWHECLVLDAVSELDSGV